MDWHLIAGMAILFGVFVYVTDFKFAVLMSLIFVGIILSVIGLRSILP